MTARSGLAEEADRPRVEPDGTVHVPAFDLPESVYLDGCSAGAMLTAQTVAYLLRNELPAPGGIGLFCAGIPMTEGAVPGVFKMGRSESAFLVSAINGFPRPVERTSPPRASGYFSGVEADDPLVAPGDHDELLARFPPSFLISGTRDFALGGVLASHNKLVRLGVEADLHIWEGLGHATFAFNPRLPESDEVRSVIVRFFDRHLARSRRRTA
ncbi:MAG: alpha/beta hydrolase fold domain-containing protein [Gammaproteobacteria bacterium]|nr:alpha/beta hydrolase fold domain-containing protein [Gammaproteobacteria bacterium]